MTRKMNHVKALLGCRANRWTTVPHFPLTQTLTKAFPQGQKKSVLTPEIVSEKLCDDILHRLSPLLLRNRPVDVLDLWPGAGLWSSKINDLLQPRRHILVEPNAIFQPVLKPLLDSRPCYKLLPTNPLASNFLSLLTKIFPEQGPSNSNRTGPMTNDTLLVLAHPPPPASKKDHFSPARWWASFMDHCIRNTGLSSHGSVRLIAFVPPVDAQSILPRTSFDKKRPAVLTEAIALHAFEVAAPQDPGIWMTHKGWDLAHQSAARVAERAAEQGIVTPEDREWPPYELAPEAPDPGLKPVPYVPRIRTKTHTRMIDTMNAEQELLDKKARTTKTDKPLKRSEKYSRVIRNLNQENRHAFARQELNKRHEKIEELTRSLSRAAADPQANSTTLRPLVNEIEALKSEIAQMRSKVHYDAIKQTPITMDDRRVVLPTGNIDDATLLWDRRPFEPLAIDPLELYPREAERTMIYFEPDSNPPAMRKLYQLEPAQRREALHLFEALTSTFSIRPLLITELFESAFPKRDINSLVQAVPSLATFAMKTLKPDFDSLPKTIHGDVEDAGGKPLDPVHCYQENLDYDLSDVRLRSLSAKTIMDICVEYQKSDQQQTATQLSRLLGGSQTSFKTGDYLTART
ncbi:uncharacterized protein KD926_007959 [Aspergillus affinis]|uniref:uncharacterized protein n=1 Tax=Aspergillus affinis TaxID=1070780 RepID=UPI0022FDCA54|nr:uncharacterized protein KD926_007959 [Aspergillus affinis]KAI9045543.1 hypothetical protein KD926_007959 [Aspergillus affinis]